MAGPEEFVEKAEQCFRLAKLNRDMADELEALGHELMAKAVALDTTRDKKQKSKTDS